eukprot:COSAG02_NODE_64006_length_261_cov_1.549383_1_plen_45_part_10
MMKNDSDNLIHFCHLTKALQCRKLHEHFSISARSLRYASTHATPL